MPGGFTPLCSKEFDRNLAGRGVMAYSQAEGGCFMGASPEVLERFRPKNQMFKVIEL
jgi:hypothetical protein